MIGLMGIFKGRSRWSRARALIQTARASDGLPRPILVLRTNPKDSSLRRVVTLLMSRYCVRVLAWDRRRDLEFPVRGSNVELRVATLRAGYYDVSALVGVMLLQPWFLLQGILSRPRAVHAMDLDTGLPGWLIARSFRVPFIYHCLDPYYAALPPRWPTALGRLTRWVEDRIISSADLFVITDTRRLAQHPSARPKRVVELVNAPLDQPAVSGPRNGADPMVVGYIGSLVPHRNLDTLVRTVGRMSAEGLALVIGGFGPMADEVQSACARYPNVVYRGWVTDEEMVDLQSSFDVFVQIEDPGHPAYRWVSPNKLFDSMAFGRPIVVAHGTLAAQTVAEVGHGVAVQYGNERELADALRQLRDDPGGRQAMGQLGIQAYRERWSPDRQRDQLLTAYAAALAGE